VKEFATLEVNELHHYLEYVRHN